MKPVRRSRGLILLPVLGLTLGGLSSGAATGTRRLNRYEYNATVRDLLGVDFQPAADFPADNFTYGFDDNAGTLTVTPALLTKYLEAAKKIARAAVEPVAAPTAPHFDRRQNPSHIRDISWQRDFTWDGDYDLHIAIAGRADPATIYVSIDGGEPQTIASSGDFEGRRYADVQLHVDSGRHEVRVNMVRDFDRALAAAWDYEVGAAKKAEKEPAAKEEIRKKLEAGTLKDYAGAVGSPYAETLELRGPNGPVLPAIPAGYRLLFRCGHAPGQHTPACLRSNLTTLAARAYRRPVGVAEVDRLLALAGQAGGSIDQQMETAIEAILVSPPFLFRMENEPRLNDSALASRLSYFLWSSMPDEELSRAKLNDDAALAKEAERMLADPKSNALAENFAAQWLEFRNLDVIHRDPAAFPTFNDDLRDAMRRETELFIESVMRERRSILDFLTARYTFLNEPLARIYGIPGVEGDRFRKVNLEGTPRTGLLTEASILTVTSYATRTSPVLRGKWILDNILNEPPPPPPANVPALRDASSEPALTLRQQLEEHRANPACAACHSRMDPPGFGLENFDAIGRFRQKDGGHPIDSAGSLPDGSTFSNPQELAAVLAKHPDAFAEGLTEKLLIFALGRGLKGDDRAAAHEIVQKAAPEYRFSDLILGVAESPVFRTGGAHE